MEKATPPPDPPVPPPDCRGQTEPEDMTITVDALLQVGELLLFFLVLAIVVVAIRKRDE